MTTTKKPRVKTISLVLDEGCSPIKSERATPRHPTGKPTERSPPQAVNKLNLTASSGNLTLRVAHPQESSSTKLTCFDKTTIVGNPSTQVLADVLSHINTKNSYLREVGPTSAQLLRDRLVQPSQRSAFGAAQQFNREYLDAEEPMVE